MRFLLIAAAVLSAAAFACSDGDSENPGQTPATGTPAVTAPAGQTPSAVPQVAVQRLVTGLTRPTFVTNAQDGSGRLFVLEKGGRIDIIKDGALLKTPMLDLTPIVLSSGNEQGLLGLAFHPEFAKNGRFFVAYTAKNSNDTVAEYHMDPASDTADANSAKVMLSVPDPFPNHNGGMLAFGPDRYLYTSFGDGGSGGDPNGNGQNTSVFLGKILRLDVDGGSPYAIPKTNPFANNSSAKQEIWAYGFRNPWRFGFDRKTGDLWIADVGQDKYEEVDFQPAGDKGGQNYGWNVMEGNHCYRPASNCDQSGLTKPIFEYSHDDGCSITGGYVYRGSAIPGLAGRYLLTDYCKPTLYATTRAADGSFSTQQLDTLPNGVSSFGEDEAGELYITVDSEGAVYRLTGK
jgi:glucose/arabinose dehydrogenase